MRNSLLGSLLYLLMSLRVFGTVTYTAEETDNLFFLLTDEQKLGYCDLYRAELNTIESLKDKCTDFGLQVIERENIVVLGNGNGGGASTNRILDAILAKLEGNIESPIDLRPFISNEQFPEAFRGVGNTKFILQTRPKTVSELFQYQLRESGFQIPTPLDPQKITGLDPAQIEELLKGNPVLLNEIPIKQRK